MAVRLEILLVEDEENDALLLERALRREGTYDPAIRRVDSELPLREALTSQSWDIIISDWNMPCLEGIRVFAVFREYELDIPFVYLSSTIGEEPVVEALKAGAHNFLFKSSLAAVAPAIRRELAEAEGRRQRRLSEEALRASESRFRALWQEVRDAVVTTDSAGRVMMFNRAAEQMFGYSCEEIQGEPLARLFAPTSQARTLLELLDPGVDGSTPGHLVERTLSRRGGAEFPAEISLTRWNESGQTLFAGVIRDISERRRAEELRLARDAAVATARAKTEFLATMSHEIRTPMNAVIGMTSLLLDTTLTELQREFVETVRLSGEHLLGVINNVLDFSKLEAGGVELDRHPFDLRACVEDALDLISLRVAEKGLDLAYIEDPRAHRMILGDVARMRQVLLNLLGNAAKFTERGEIVVESTLIRALDSAHEIRVEVRDTGIGMNEEQRARIFRPFSQAEPSTTRKYGGTGLGLAICKQIVESMGGSIGVESVPDGGSTFWFTFLAAAQSPRSGEESAPERLRGRRLLVVDDNRTHRRILGLRAEKWGMLPVLEGSPSAALGRVRLHEEFDVALIDHHMPEMDGITLARELRRLRSPAEMPLVLMTSMGSARRLIESSEVEAMSVLTKPLRDALLRDTLLAALDHRPPALRMRGVAAASPPTALRPLRILLAEDNPFNQRVARLLLERMGQRIDIVTNGQEVLAAVERTEYDLILMDVEMPEMDGLSAARETRARLGRRAPRIVAMTANALVGDRERYLAAGMDDYVSKPIDARELRRVLEACAASR